MTSRKPTPAPNTKSDIQWLIDLGYLNGFHDFMHDYGFIDDEQDRRDALSLFRQFRNEQQEAWEKTHHEELKSETLIESSRTYSRTSMSIYSSSEHSVSKKGKGTSTSTVKGSKA
ncbi:57f7d3aa-7e26-49c9-b8a5-2dc3ae1a92db-CDS [Sclerotinia trifoliorum]|uniref:57f7d3aa-7e26-49c9-b8a5-2dc3ae1a92db-CDS n=1 Tax=Sclerotinia trifoliorum TaxID=28548 RepID=A0A8H2VLC5_9HELO|nr:57f7d3aa-7e26-49c9-b8a5-2dc3ae1a92db-CDS [Sclerotinia trifoliorum]